MMPTFHRKQVELYRDEMVGYTEDVLQRWQPGQTIDLSHAMQMLTLRITSKTLFGIDTTDQAEGVGQLVRRSLDTPFFSPQIMMFPFDLPGTPFHRSLRTAKALDHALLQLIQRKRSRLDEQHDVMATLIQARGEDNGTLSDQELLGHAITLLIAGHETTANTLSWTLLLLDQHPRVLADVVDEVSGVLRGSAPTVEQLGRMPLLERVIKESMRLLPTAAIGSRVSTGPFELGPYHFPRRTFVNFSQYLTHRLPELYPEPQRFKPERWETIDPSPYEYLPFGAGPRMCIGATFAMTELRIVLAMLLQRFRLAVVPDAQIDWGMTITLGIKGPLPMTVVAQDRRFSKTTIRGSIHELVDLS